MTTVWWYGNKHGDFWRLQSPRMSDVAFAYEPQAVRPRTHEPRILVAVPVYNEAHYLPLVLPKIIGRAGDVLVVNDGSSDGTAEALARFAGVAVIAHASNLGYGKSLIDAFQYAEEHGYEWVVTMDCDAQHDPRALHRFFELCRQDAADIISGSRYLDADTRQDCAPEDRRAINHLLTTLLNTVLGLKLTDSFCGYRAHRTSAVRSLKLTEPGYAFPMQFWPRAAARGLSVMEVPVRRIYKDASRHFGGELDDPDRRLRHYLECLTKELQCICREPHAGELLSERLAESAELAAESPPLRRRRCRCRRGTGKEQPTWSVESPAKR